MSGRIVLFGATGYTGELTARELVARGAKPVLAARSADRVAALAAELGGLEVAVADVSDPSSVANLVNEGDALLTTVGPFVRLGQAALDAAIAKKAHYIDSTGEPAWIRRVFEADSRIRASGTTAVTAFGYDYVPGNLAAGLALDRADGEVSRVDVGYFFKGAFGASGGTQASLAGALLEPSFEWKDGALRTVRGVGAERTFQTSIGPRTGLGIGASEHFAIPQIDGDVRDVGAYLGWAGSHTKAARVGAAITGAVTRIPGVKQGIGAVLRKAVPGSTGGPSADQRADSGSLAVAEALDHEGKVLSHVELVGPNGYDLTASFLAWGAITLAAGKAKQSGALGPVTAFGLEELAAGCASGGFVEVS